jgi:hypothetical protein
MPIGSGFQGMKARSLRFAHSRESFLFDKITTKHSLGIRNMANSIIELRDLMEVLYEFEGDLIYHERNCKCSNECKISMDAILDEIANILAYFLERMHHSDSHLIEKMSPKIFIRNMSRLDLRNAFGHFAKCIESMCAVNCTVIESAINRF